MTRSPLRVAAAVAVLALTAAALYAAVYQRFAAQIGLRRAWTLTAQALAPQMPKDAGDPLSRRAVGVLSGLRTGSQYDQRVAMLRGSNELALGLPADAERSYSEALSWGRRPEIYVALAAAQAANGRDAAAMDSLDRALRFDPSSIIRIDRADLSAEVFRRFEARSTAEERAEAHLSIAILYLEEGFHEQGIESLARAIQNDQRILQRRELAPWSWYRDRATERLR